MVVQPMLTKRYVALTHILRTRHYSTVQDRHTVIRWNTNADRNVYIPDQMPTALHSTDNILTTATRTELQSQFAQSHRRRFRRRGGETCPLNNWSGGRQWDCQAFFQGAKATPLFPIPFFPFLSSLFPPPLSPLPFPPHLTL